MELIPNLVGEAPASGMKFDPHRESSPVLSSEHASHSVSRVGTRREPCEYFVFQSS